LEIHRENLISNLIKLNSKLHRGVNLSDIEVIYRFFNPKSVAVIGASKNPMKGGHRIMINLTRNNYKGKIYPVNPNAEGDLFGKQFYKSVSAIPEEVDLAIFYVGNSLIPGLLEECIQKGIKSAIVETAGFEEGGEKGLALRDKIVEITDNFKKIKIVGPNNMGIFKINGDSNLNTNERGGFFSGFVPFMHYKRGNIGIITQSGMLCGGYLSYILAKFPHIGFRYGASIGNKMNLGENEFLEFYLEDPTVNVIMVYLESFKDPRKFIELCRRAKSIPNKTIILLKGGMTELGQKAGASHTGALSEDSRLLDGLIKQCGVIKASNFHDLYQLADTFSKVYKTNKRMPIEGNVSMSTGSGGAGTLSSDLVRQYGLNYPDLSEEAYKKISAYYPDWMIANSFALQDLWPTQEKAMTTGRDPDSVLKDIQETMLNEPEIEGMFNMMFVSSMFHGTPNFDSMIQRFVSHPKPVFFFLLGDPKGIEGLSQELHKVDIPNFTNLEEMVRHFSALVEESKNRKRFTEKQI
jgi:acetyltransferase